MKNVLVADDKATSRELIRALMEPLGCTVIEATDGTEAVLMAQAYRLDLIILDLHMPELDGFDVLKSLRAQPRFTNTPIVALTASAMQGDRERALSAGFPNTSPSRSV